jgi:quercetin dioxygenase-like cupin family protein
MKLRTLLPILVALCSVVVHAQPTSEVAVETEPHHHQVLQNNLVRVFKVEVPPQQSTLMHHHQHDYIYVTLGATELSNEVAGNPPATLKLADGETRFSPGNFSHLVRDLANTPFRNVTVEILQDEQMRKDPGPRWDEERALHVLDKGTVDVMFVKDGVRASETELQPGGNIPRHQHKGPHLLVALTDLELRTDAEGRPPVTVKVSAGDVRWVPGGITHSITNVGSGTAKFVALEFPATE